MRRPTGQDVVGRGALGKPRRASEGLFLGLRPTRRLVCGAFAVHRCDHRSWASILQEGNSGNTLGNADHAGKLGTLLFALSIGFRRRPGRQWLSRHLVFVLAGLSANWLERAQKFEALNTNGDDVRVSFRMVPGGGGSMPGFNDARPERRRRSRSLRRCAILPTNQHCLDLGCLAGVLGSSKMDCLGKEGT